MHGLHGRGRSGQRKLLRSHTGVAPYGDLAAFCPAPAQDPALRADRGSGSGCTRALPLTAVWRHSAPHRRRTRRCVLTEEAAPAARGLCPYGGLTAFCPAPAQDPALRAEAASPGVRRLSGQGRTLSLPGMLPCRMTPKPRRFRRSASAGSKGTPKPVPHPLRDGSGCAQTACPMEFGFLALDSFPVLWYTYQNKKGSVQIHGLLLHGAIPYLQ